MISTWAILKKPKKYCNQSQAKKKSATNEWISKRMKLKEWIQMDGKEIWQKEWMIKRMKWMNKWTKRLKFWNDWMDGWKNKKKDGEKEGMNEPKEWYSRNFKQFKVWNDEFIVMLSFWNVEFGKFPTSQLVVSNCLYFFQN